MPGRNSRTKLDVGAIYKEATEIMDFSLPSEIASTRGLNALVNALEEHQRLHVRVVKLTNKVERRLNSIATDIDQKRELYKIRVRNAMVTDETIAGYSNRDQREAAAQTKYHDELHEVHELERSREEYKSLLSYVKDAEKAMDKAGFKLHNEVELAKVQAQLTRGYT